MPRFATINDMTKQHGFTVIELIVAIVFLAVATTVFFIQKNDIEISSRNQERKTAINAMYYSLEEVYFKDNKHYPETLNSETLPSVDPELFKDQNGVAIGEQNSEYRYEPSGCENARCTGYMLRASLENEEDFIKNNR